MDKQVKSKQRVADHGEVFTAEREVNAMLDLVKPETERIDSRFLEPACGDGNFLAEILRRKMDLVKRKYRKLPFDFEMNAVLAVGSIYGIDILQDNVEACRERLFKIWDKYYSSVCKKEIHEDCRQSVKFILKRNILCGNALSLHEVDSDGNDTDQLIVFSQWAMPTSGMIKREDFVFRDMMEDNKKVPVNSESEQITLFSQNSEEDNEGGELVQVYPPIYYRRIWEYGN